DGIFLPVPDSPSFLFSQGDCIVSLSGCGFCRRWKTWTWMTEAGSAGTRNKQQQQIPCGNDRKKSKCGRSVPFKAESSGRIFCAPAACLCGFAFAALFLCCFAGFGFTAFDFGV